MCERLRLLIPRIHVVSLEEHDAFSAILVDTVQRVGAGKQRQEKRGLLVVLQNERGIFCAQRARALVRLPIRIRGESVRAAVDLYLRIARSLLDSARR